MIKTDPFNLKVATYNIHKGMSFFNRKLTLAGQRELIRSLNADIVFLQEVREEFLKHSNRFQEWPERGQTHFLAEAVGQHYAYAKNAVYAEGHHGNAILSRYEISQFHHHDISSHQVEQRGLIHALINLPEVAQPLHCICVHLGLLARWRNKQFRALADYIGGNVPEYAPLIIAGDFNDWTCRGGDAPLAALGLHEAFKTMHGSSARSFPALLPLLRLDRIYIRGFTIHHAHVAHGLHSARVSDHAALSVELQSLAHQADL